MLVADNAKSIRGYSPAPMSQGDVNEATCPSDLKESINQTLPEEPTKGGHSSTNPPVSPSLLEGRFISLITYMTSGEYALVPGSDTCTPCRVPAWIILPSTAAAVQIIDEACGASDKHRLFRSPVPWVSFELGRPVQLGFPATLEQTAEECHFGVL